MGPEETLLTTSSPASSCLPLVQGGQGPDSWERAHWATAAPGDMEQLHSEVGERRSEPRPLPGAWGWCHGAPGSTERMAEHVEEKRPRFHSAARPSSVPNWLLGPGTAVLCFYVYFPEPFPAPTQWTTGTNLLSAQLASHNGKTFKTKHRKASSQAGWKGFRWTCGGKISESWPIPASILTGVMLTEQSRCNKELCEPRNTPMHLRPINL